VTSEVSGVSGESSDVQRWRSEQRRLSQRRRRRADENEKLRMEV
jgi:hypothetical protein